jgi:predicted HAD superfamily Cof-like phosphohydrolase
MGDTPAELVAEFQETFDAKDKDLYYKLCIEEANEFLEAVEHLLKEAADFIYVSSGFMNLGGHEDSLRANDDILAADGWLASLFTVDASTLMEAFRRVHASNMSKVGDDGKPIRNEFGKVLKGPNYKPPVLTDLVRG